MLERDLALIKVAANHENRPHLMELVKTFRGRVVDVSPESVIVEVSDTTEKIDGLLEVLRPFGVLEMGRTGRIAMTRGNDVLRPPVESPVPKQPEPASK
jgi:acetolactate synthase-1/3 small subunit